MSEERDLEKELKEARDQYEAENQEIYDEVTKGNEELRRKQEKEAEEEEDTDEDPTTDKLESRGYKGNRESARQRQIRLRQKALADRDTEGSTVTRGPGQVFTGGKDTVEVPDRDMRTGQLIPNETELDQFGNPRLAASITTEIGLNLLLDIFSFAPPAQAVGSAWINYLAQKIRGEKDINKLEMTAASIASQIPLLGSFKGATKAGRFGKGVVQGGVTGAIEETGYSLGRGEEADVLGGAVFGGLVGGLFNARNAPAAFDAIKSKLNTGSSDQLNKLALEGVPNTAFAIKNNEGGLTPEEVRKQFEPKQPVEGGFTKESIQQSISDTETKINALYDNERLGDTIDETLTARQKREKFGRKLKSTDLDTFIQEEALKGNTIDPAKAQEYVDLVNDSRLGKKEYITNAEGKKRLRRNNKGFIGAISYLNAVALGTNPKDLKGQVDVIKHISKEMGTDATGLKRIIEGQGGEISFQTEGMKKPVKIRSLSELVDAYMGRLQRYKEIPAFEKGHFFAADNIINDRDISSLTDFKDNLHPEISRSIRAQLDDDAIEELIKIKGKVKPEYFYENLKDGNRKRKNRDDPDKILADLLGTQYGLRESFLSFVYPERSLSNLIPEDSKAAFAELYRKELLEKIKNLRGQLTGQSSFGIATIDNMKMDVARSVAEEMKNNKILNAIILMDDQIYKRPMTELGEAKPLPDDPVKTEKDKTIKKDTKQEGE